MELTNKEKYYSLCNTNSSIPLFNQAWYLDIVCGKDGWDVILIEVNNQIVASWTYFLRKHLIFKKIEMPPLTQNMGLWLAAEEVKYCTSLSNQKKYIDQLIKKLPKVKTIYQQFSPNIINFLPFIWKGFTIALRYTYQINTQKSLEEINKDFTDHMRNNIKLAEVRNQLKVRVSNDIQRFCELYPNVFFHQNRQPMFDSLILNRLCSESLLNNKGTLLAAVDKEGNELAYVFLVWDATTVYYLASSYQLETRNNKAICLLLWEAIKLAHIKGKNFDFEGSMIEQIEKFFRGFGAKQVPYYSISKTYSKLYRLLFILRELILK